MHTKLHRCRRCSATPFRDLCLLVPQGYILHALVERITGHLDVTPVDICECRWRLYVQHAVVSGDRSTRIGIERFCGRELYVCTWCACASPGGGGRGSEKCGKRERTVRGNERWRTARPEAGEASKASARASHRAPEPCRSTAPGAVVRESSHAQRYSLPGCWVRACSQTRLARGSTRIILPACLPHRAMLAMRRTMSPRQFLIRDILAPRRPSAHRLIVRAAGVFRRLRHIPRETPSHFACSPSLRHPGRCVSQRQG